MEAALAGAGRRVFGDRTHKPDVPDFKVLYAKIGQLAPENDFLEGARIKAGLRNGTCCPIN